MTTQKLDLLQRSVKEFCEQITEPEILQLLNLDTGEKQIILLLFKEGKSLEEVCHLSQMSTYRVLSIHATALLAIKERILMRLKSISEFDRIRIEIDNLKKENEAYKQRFARLPVQVKEMIGDITVFKRPVESLRISVRLSNTLRYARINTIGDLMEWSEERLLRQPHMGRTSLKLLKEILAEIGLELQKR